MLERLPQEPLSLIIDEVRSVTFYLRQSVVLDSQSRYTQRTSKALRAACLHALWRPVTFKLRNSDSVSKFKLVGFPSHRLPFAGGIELSTAAGNKLRG
jgi:hypothetical protein